MEEKQEEKKQNPQIDIPQAVNIARGFSGKNLGSKILFQGARSVATSLLANPWIWVVIGVIAFVFIATFLIVGFSGAPGQPEGEEIPISTPTPAL